MLIDLVLFAAPLEAILYISAFVMMRRYRISRRNMAAMLRPQQIFKTEFAIVRFAEIILSDNV